MTKPKLYIVPGWGEKITHKNYKSLVAYAQKYFTVVPIIYNSKKTSLFSENIAEIASQIVGPQSKNTILGFSTGALIAYQLASRYKFKKVLACSMSAILDTDLALYSEKAVKSTFTPTQVKNLRKLRYKKPIAPVVLLYGTKEGPELIGHSKKQHKKYGGILIPIENGAHRLSGKYLATIKKIL